VQLPAWLLISEEDPASSGALPSHVQARETLFLFTVARVRRRSLYTPRPDILIP